MTAAAFHLLDQYWIIYFSPRVNDANRRAGPLIGGSASSRRAGPGGRISWQNDRSDENCWIL